jgi:hypothetical protein
MSAAQYGSSTAAPAQSSPPAPSCVHTPNLTPISFNPHSVTGGLICRILPLTQSLKRVQARGTAEQEAVLSPSGREPVADMCANVLDYNLIILTAHGKEFSTDSHTICSITEPCSSPATYDNTVSVI